MKRLSIIIVCYKSLHLLQDCFTSIIIFNDIAYENIEIILVDNSPSEYAVEVKKFIANLNFPIDIKYIRNVNKGYGQGNNIGIKASSGKIISIMNPDVRLSEPIFKSVLENFNDNKLGILSFAQKGGSNLSFYFKPEFNFPFLSSTILKMLNKFNLFFPKIHFLSGAFFFVDREKFENAGLFDENIFMYFEESDVARRMSIHKTKFDQNKTYLHLIGDREEISQESFRRSLDSLEYYLGKYNLDRNKYYSRLLLGYKINYLFAKILRRKKETERFYGYINAVKNISKL